MDLKTVTHRFYSKTLSTCDFYSILMMILILDILGAECSTGLTCGLIWNKGHHAVTGFPGVVPLSNNINLQATHSLKITWWGENARGSCGLYICS